MEWIEEVTKRREQSGQSKERMYTYLCLQEHLKIFLRGRKVLLVEVNKSSSLISFATLPPRQQTEEQRG